MPKKLFLLFVLLLGFTATIVGQESTSDVPGQTELYEPLTFTVEVSPSLYNNPFDAADIEVVGIFQSPSGQELVMPGFWMQPYEDGCPPACSSEDLQPSGEPTWQVRFTPQEVGDWMYTLLVRDNSATVTTIEGQFTVTPSERPGFIRVGANRRYFQYHNGQPYFPIGHNLKWSWEGAGGIEAYRRWFEDLQASGGNYARLVIDTPWFIGLEWESPAGDYRAAQRAAARLDKILDLAAEYGIALQLVLLWNESLRYFSDPPVLIPDAPPRPDISFDWDNHSYNVLNGGILSGPGIFLFDRPAQELFKRRLRYIVSRWGYSPQVFAWEIIDKIDRVVNFETNVADVWVQTMAGYIRQIDQHGHLITAGSSQFDALLAANPLLDFSEGEFYQRRPLQSVSDQVTGVLGVIRRSLNANTSPTLLTDFSLNPWFEPTADDADGVHFQNTLWASALSGAAGSVGGDWWETYIVPQNLSRYYTPLAAFVSGIDWPTLDLHPAEAGIALSDSTVYRSVRVTGYDRRFTAFRTNPVEVTITPDGIFPSPDTVPSYLYGQVYYTQFRYPHTYFVAPPIDTHLEVRVSSVSRDFNARLQVTVDGVVVSEIEMPAGSRNVAVRIPLTAGEHTIILDNTGDDWLELDYVEVAHLFAPARALTLRDSSAGIALAWLHHRDFVWDKVAAGETRQPIAAQFRLGNMPSGRYRAEIWDPLTGTVVGEEILNVYGDGVLSLNLLPFDAELALRVFRLGDIPAETLSVTETPTPNPTVTPTVPPAITATQTERAPFVIATNTPRPSETSSP
jgi:hypothetical protein